MQCHYLTKVIGKLDSLTTAVREINCAVHSCLSRLADIELVVSAGVPCHWSLPTDLPPTVTPTQPRRPSSIHTKSVLSSTPSGSQQLPTPEPVLHTPGSSNTHQQELPPQQPSAHAVPTATLYQPPPNPVSSSSQQQPVSPSPQQPSTPTVRTQEEPELLTLDQVMRIKQASSSRMNFSANLNRWLFTEDERATSNVRGKMNKRMLDAKIVAYIKRVTFRLFPLENSENLEKAWSACVIAIDEANRRLNKTKKNA